jgi:predicted DsbA family dithiol-disulfide isomerase
MAGSTRRDLLRIGAVIGIVALVTARPWASGRGRDGDWTFEYIPDLPPLRRLVSDQTSATGSAREAVFVGLPPPDASTGPAPETLDAATVCDLLGLPWPEGAPIPVTYFTDIACTICRALERDLAALSEAYPGLFRRVTREYPILGPRSVAAARVIRAAEAQGAAEVVRKHLQTRPAPESRTALAAMAGTLGLDATDLRAAWESDRVTDTLARDHALARRLGFAGTPGLVIGRTVLTGALPRASLLRLMQTEAAEDPPQACA